ncbi:MAG: metallophosphoesterase [Thermodesulfobacteriota bacterium]
MKAFARPRRGLIPLVLVLGLALAAPAGALTVQGLARGPAGEPLAGALVSDGRAVAMSDAAGRFRLSTEPGRAVWVCPPAGFAPPEPGWWPAEQAAAGRLEIALAAQAPRPAYRAALLSDPHLLDALAPTVNYPPPPGGHDLPLKVWRRVAGELHALRPDLTLVAGDLCMDGDEGDDAHAEAQLGLAARALAELPRPALAIPGNHDARYRDQADPPAVDLAPWRRHLGPERRAARLGPTVWIAWDNLGRGADAKGKPRALGATPDEALAWLEALLAHLDPATPLVLATHYPPASPLAGVNPLWRRNLVKADSQSGLGLRDVDQNLARVARLLAGRRVLAWLHGHEHAHHETVLFLRQGPWRVLGLPAVCGRWWLGDRDWGPLAFIPAYLVLTLTPGPDGVGMASRAVEVQF